MRESAFLARMEMLVPWVAFCALIESHYPKVGNRRPAGGFGVNASNVLDRQLVQLD